MTTTEKRKYHTIRVPVKKTSSEYFTMLRRGKVEPEKYCAYCGARLHRKYNKENGRWEDWSQFLNRKCCDNICAQKLRFYGKHEDRQKAIPDEKGKDSDVFKRAIYNLAMENNINLQDYLNGKKIAYYDHQHDKKGKLISVKAKFVRR